jgi:predicted ATPase/class 3 adenylate cyclase
MVDLPQGTVTFLFTDIEGSTRLVQELGPAYRGVLERHQSLLREAFRDGVEVGTEGDSFFVVFADVERAVGAAVAAQRALAVEAWPGGRPVRVRMGLHTGQGTLGGDSYIGVDVHRAARIAAAAHGGQVLLSESTRALAERALPDGVTVRDLGAHRLKDLAVPERISQLVIEGLEAAFPAIVSIGDRRTNLPAPLTSFVGREAELAQVRAMVRAGRLVTVVGTGGTGKTRLLLEAGATLADGWTDGAWLVELAPISDPELLPQAVARAIGAREEPGRPTMEAIEDFLRPKRLLLLLDNCEHLIGPAAETAERLLAAAPGLSILATSREALDAVGEMVFQLPSLDMPDDADHGTGDAWRERALASEAVRLFTERATAALPGFSLAGADLGAVAEICRRLDGIPLAIELAAARVPVLSVSDIALRLGDRFRLLTGGRRTAVPRQQTLQAAIDWSWDLLTDAERRLLCRISVFAGGCTVDAAAAVAMDGPADAGDAAFATLELLSHLVAKSLVIVDRQATPTRYRQLETIRQYSRERLVEAGASAEIRHRHLAYFVALAERIGERLLGADMAAALKELDPELDNIRAAVEWGLEEDVASAMRICLAVAVYGHTRSLAEGFELLSRAAEAVDRLPDGENSALAARILAAGANAAWMVGRAPQGAKWAERAFVIAERIGDRRGRYEALKERAMTLVFMGREEDALPRADEAVRIAEEFDDWRSIAFIHAGLAQWEAERGDAAAAAIRLASATAAAHRSGSPEAIAFAELSHGRVAGFSRRLDEARAAFARSIDAYAEIEDDGLVLVARSDLAHALRHNGAIEEALPIYRETIHDWQHTGNRGAIANQLESFAFLLEGSDPTTAARLLGAAAALRDAADAPRLSFERTEFDEAGARLRAHLGEGAYRDAFTDGRGLDAEAAIALALKATSED